MAIISNQTISLVPFAPGGTMGVLVTYQVIWEPGDVGQVFVTSAALHGKDPVADDSLAPMNATPAAFAGQPVGSLPLVGFALNVLPQADLNEDRDLDLIVAALKNRDEIFGRISLTSVFGGGKVSADTNEITGDFGP